MAWTYTYDTDTPLGSNSPSVIDDRIREAKDAVQERQNIDHYWPLTGSEVSDTDAGKHRQVTFQAPLSANPTTVDEDEGQLYTKDVSGKAELFWIDEDENALQITDGGTLNITSSDLVGTLANDTYFSAVDAAGTGTTDLIKAGRNEADDADVPQIPDATRLASNAAPTEDTQIANMKYVKDRTPGFGTLATGSVTLDAVSDALTTDAFLTIIVDASSMSGTAGGVTLYADSSNPPTTEAAKESCSYALDARDKTITVFLKSGWRWKFSQTAGTPADCVTATYRLVPIGP